MSKFVRFDKKDRVVEIIEIELADFKKSFHEGTRDKFTKFNSNKSINTGDVLDGGSFKPYVKPALSLEDQSKKDKREASSKAERLEKKAIWNILKFITSLENCPQELKDIKAAIKVERDKL